MATLLPLDPDQLLTTTRSVRKRLDLETPVDLAVIRECIDVATQAPTGGNNQGWHWLVVTDPEKKKPIAEWYRDAFKAFYGNKESVLGNLPQGDAAYVSTTTSNFGATMARCRSISASRPSASRRKRTCRSWFTLSPPMVRRPMWPRYHATFSGEDANSATPAPASVIFEVEPNTKARSG